MGLKEFKKIRDIPGNLNHIVHMNATFVSRTQTEFNRSTVVERLPSGGLRTTEYKKDAFGPCWGIVSVSFELDTDRAAYEAAVTLPEIDPLDFL